MFNGCANYYFAPFSDRRNPEDPPDARTFVHMQRSSLNSNRDSRGCFPQLGWYCSGLHDVGGGRGALMRATEVLLHV